MTNALYYPLAPEASPASQANRLLTSIWLHTVLYHHETVALLPSLRIKPYT